VICQYEIQANGLSNIKFSTVIPFSSAEISTHKSFMDTIGRPTVVLTAYNAVEDWRDRADLIVTYEYPLIASFRKPLTIAITAFGLFFTVWVIGNLDVRIGKKA
jgi:oligosaccharyltransferase complex subunit alpha (ribophorin I)